MDGRFVLVVVVIMATVLFKFGLENTFMNLVTRGFDVCFFV
jgi:hypothetical protein